MQFRIMGMNTCIRFRGIELICFILDNGGFTSNNKSVGKTPWDKLLMMIF